MIRTYYKNTHGMYEHMGDAVMSVDELCKYLGNVSKMISDIYSNKK